LDDQIFIYLAVVPLLGMLAQVVAWWIRIPSILLLLGFGVLLGVWMNPDEILSGSGVGIDSNIGPRVVFPFVSLAVAVILFEGGMSLKFRELKSAGGSSIVRLCTVGALVSWVLTSLLAVWIRDIQWRLAVLLGAVLVVTGPTVVSPLLRHIRPSKKIGSIVKWEGIIIDPIGAILAVLVFEQLFHTGHDGVVAGTLASPVWSAVAGILTTASIGLCFGCATAWILVEVVKRYWLPDYLHGLAFLSSALGVFALSNWLMHESGLVTVTVMGIYLANQSQVAIEHVVEFKENLGVFLISCLFIVLGSRLDLAVIGQLGWRGGVFLALMIVLVRPISIFVATIGSRLEVPDKVFLACLAPRGIVAAAVISVFALRIEGLEGIEGVADEQLIRDAAKLVPATFLVIVGTVAVYGLAAAPIARRLGLADANPQGILFAGADPWIQDIALQLKDSGYAAVLIDTNFRNVSAARQKGIPAHCKSVLSEFVREEVDLAGIGRLFALTKNDAVNVMAAKEYSHLFGSKNVYRLSPADSGKGERAKVGQSAKGRELFCNDWSERRLQAAYAEGYRAKTTRITDEFTFAEFKYRNGDEVVVLMVIDKNGVIQINTVGQNLEPVSGQSLIALVPSNAPPAETAPTARE